MELELQSPILFSLEATFYPNFLLFILYVSEKLESETAVQKRHGRSRLVLCITQYERFLNISGNWKNAKFFAPFCTNLTLPDSSKLIAKYCFFWFGANPESDLNFGPRNCLSMRERSTDDQLIFYYTREVFPGELTEELSSDSSSVVIYFRFTENEANPQCDPLNLRP